MGRADEERLVADMIELTRQYGRYGYRLIAALLRDAGWHVKRQARRTFVATREAESANETTEEGAALAE